MRTRSLTKSNDHPASIPGRLRRAARALAARAGAAVGRAHEGRRGSVIILAVAVLAVIAVAGVAYVTVVRLGRNSVVAYSNTVNYHQQVNAVVSEMQAILTADLFGNKIVTTATPRRVDNPPGGMPSGAFVWPRMFEDGEYFDLPHTELRTINISVGFPPYPDAELDPNLPDERMALPDDAWLASFEPVHPNVPDGPNWSQWPQITNLRTAYRYDAREDVKKWVRGDGRFVDLAQWFVQAHNNRGNPSADLSPDQLDDINGSLMNNGSPALDQFTAGRLISQFDEINSFQFRWDDTRMWADTDGDGLADARWQQLDSLGDLFGLKWVVAARIVDNSAMANVNSHLALSSLSPADPEVARRIGDGLTPADVDLHRLLHTFGQTTLNRRHRDIANSFSGEDIEFAFREHMEEGFRIEAMLEQLEPMGAPSDPAPARDLLNLTNDSDWRTDYIWEAGPLRLQREAMWRYFGSSPKSPVATRVVGYPIGDEVGLRAYHGFNYESLLTKIELRLDGPAISGYLPGAGGEGAANEFGLMRSKSRDSASIWRRPDGNSQVGFDFGRKIERIRNDVRRFLTTESGAADFSPVPTINTKAVEFENRFSNRRVHVRDLARATGVDRDRLIQRSFESFVWALAPLATDEELVRGTGAPWTNSDFHYGGSRSGHAPKGPATTIEDTGGFGPMGASYAVNRAASLAVNLADAVDREGGAGLPTEHTIVRLYPRIDPPAPMEPEISLGMRFSHGDIVDILNQPPALPVAYSGTVADGVTLVGLDRQPFIREVHTFAAYRDRAVLNNGSPDDQPLDGAIDPTDFNEQMLSVFAVELGNPWPEEIKLDNYVIRFGVDGVRYFDFRILNTTIAPGDFGVFAFKWANPGTLYGQYDPNAGAGAGPGDPGNPGDPGGGPGIETPQGLDAERVFAEWVGRIGELRVGTLIYAGGKDTQSLNAIPYDDMVSGRSSYVFFSELLQGHTVSDIGEVSTVSIYYRPQNDPANPLYLVDRIDSHNTTGLSVDSFPAGLVDTFPLDTATNTGMISFSSSISRSITKPAEGGFPAYVVEFDELLGVNRLEPIPYLDYQWDLGGMPPEVNPDSPEQIVPLAPNFSIGQEPKPADANLASILPDGLKGFELFVADEPLRFQSELLRLCAFTHMCMNNQLETPDQWQTVSEQLGRPENLFYDGLGLSASNEINPYLGTLDPTRYIIAQNGDLSAPSVGAVPFPNTFSIPLALRVVDCFETLWPVDKIARGRININTAPREVLELLPWVNPKTPGDLTSPATIGTWTSAEGDNRVRLMGDYRRAQPGLAPADLTLLSGTPASGLRQETNPPPAPGKPLGGFATPAELAILGEWAADGMPVVGGSASAFLELGADTMRNFGLDAATQTRPPFDYRRDERGNGAVGVADSFFPNNGVAERLAIYKAVSNIASSRSDVFTAWFIVRGYDPQAIEAIDVAAGSADADELLNEIEPTFEQRWLAVFDRSGVQRPTDRPRVLLLVELPRDIPLGADN